MKNDAEQLFKALQAPTLPEQLEEKIMMRITRETRRRSARRMVVFSCVAILSAISLEPAIVAFMNEASQSGFAELISSAFRDTSLLYSMWQDYALSILESLPAMSLALAALAAAALIASTRESVYYFRQYRNATNAA